jgi:polar amino acid transport system ATP-binding protein
MSVVPKVRLDRVTKSFGDAPVLVGVSLDVAVGEVVTFIGASGSGKTTLLRCINLLEPIDDGAILLDGDEISRVGRDPNPVRRRIGIVFQAFNLFPHMTVRRNVTLALTEVLGASRDEAEGRALELLGRFALADRADAYPDRLSGGQQQRVAIVRALAMRPEVLLLDEVTSALDPALVGEVLDVVRELKGSGITMLIATHEMGFAREISDRVCHLDGGAIVESGPPAAIFGDARDERTRRFLGRSLAR